jgi:hypothetical protein
MKRILYFSTIIALHTGIATATPLAFATEQAINAIKTATIQHTIVQNTLSYPTPSTQTQNTSTPMYGTLKTYGEYNDDGMIGHNGGDTQSALANIWLDWQHTTDDITPNDLKSFDSKYDIATFGLSGHNKQTKHSTYNWTFYSGYINGTSKNSELHSAEHGGFIGIHNRINTKNFVINSTINTGSIKHNTDYMSLHDKYINIWFGAGTNLAYSIKLFDTFNICPNLSIGYTWIKNQTQNELYSDDLQDQTFGFLELTPGILATKHIADNWFGTLSVKHTVSSIADKHIMLNDTEFTLPNINNYTEFGITLKKQANSFVFTANINRREGDICGWAGGLNIKYIF